MRPLSDTVRLRAWRERLVAGGLSALLCALAVRLIELHVWRSGQFHTVASRQQSDLETIPARPGDIVDRRGRVLATSVVDQSLFVVPARIERAWEFSRALASALDADPDELFERVSSRPDRAFLWIKRRLSPDEVERVRLAKLPAEAWGLREEFRRVYPQGAVAAQVIGLRDLDNRGRGGVEEACDARLRGRDGARRILRDARGRVLEALEVDNQPLQDGERIELSLDVVVQLYAEQALEEVAREWRPKSCCAVVMDPLTSDVLAMASWPSFDPNDPSNIPEAAWKNRTLADMYEPGSTFKPFVVAWAMKQGQLRRDEVFDCENGEYRMGRRLLHDHHRYGSLDVTDILVKSSNIGMAKIGERLGNPGLFDAATHFGFGAPTGIGLPGELAGQLRPLTDWNGYSTGSVPMGQEIAVTPLQMAAGYCALAGTGVWRTPRLILEPTREGLPGGDITDTASIAVPRLDADAASGLEVVPGTSDPIHESVIRDLREGETLPGDEPVIDREPAVSASPVDSTSPDTELSPRQASGVVSRVVDPEIARWICRVPLAEVVTRGTGKKARLPSYRVFGKSGTAQKPDPQTGAYSNRLHVSSFVCGAPADRPRVIVVVSVDEPSTPGEHFGGTVAAPAAARILERTLELLGVPPGDPGPVASVERESIPD